MSGQVDKDPQAPPRGEIKKPPKITNREPNNVDRGLEGGAKERSMENLHGIKQNGNYLFLNVVYMS